MKSSNHYRYAILILFGLLLFGQIAQVAAAPWDGNRANFADPRFERTWSMADQAVVNGQAQRSWTWGPQPWFDYKEFYKQSPNGLRQVQYFDKSRMEINHPEDRSGTLQGVTNGLLVVEMVSGRMKLGDGIDYEQNVTVNSPASIPVAGDPLIMNDQAPTYLSFFGVATVDNGYRDPERLGKFVNATMHVGGVVGSDAQLGKTPGVEVVAYENQTGHNVPRVFNDFRNAGPIAAILTFGYPITDAYWVKAKVGGVERDVMVQLFERRVLTYTPSNPAAFQVEMGNVGQHYFQWRYPHLGMPWAAGDPYIPITFASNQNSQYFHIDMIDPSGSNRQTIVDSGQDLHPFSLRRAWGSRSWDSIFFDRTETNGQRSIFINQYSNLDDGARSDFHPALSPDGTKLAFVSTRDGNAELYLISLMAAPLPGPIPVRLTETKDCINQYPAWLPDGSGLVYESNCQGNFDIYRAMLEYSQDAPNDLRIARLISPGEERTMRLTHSDAADQFPRISPNGAMIAFSSTRDGNAEIYIMNIDGSNVLRLTNDSGVDQAPAWSPDSTKLVFNSNRTGNHELYIINRNGSDLRQLTHNGGENGYSVWAQ